MSGSLRVAAVQMECEPLQTERNLTKAHGLVAQAASQGAQLVLLPELMPGGYVLTEEIWSTAEPLGGRSIQWMAETARQFGIYLGASLLEADGSDFYNAFYLMTPEGAVAGRVRKNPPASVEAYFYRGGSEPHVIDTELGRIGVGICYENLLHCRIAEFFDASVDLVLQPTSAGTPTATFPVRPKDAVAFETMLGNGPRENALALGVPVVMANKCGPLVTALPGGFPPQNTRFPGLSAIVDGDGSVKAALGSDEGVIVADVMLDPTRKAAIPPRAHGRWSLKVPWYAFLWPLSQWMGERDYARNPARAKNARAISGG